MYRQKLQQTLARTSSGSGTAYEWFSPAGVSPFGWDAQVFRFDLDDLKARSNLMSLSYDLQDADEEAVENLEKADRKLAPDGSRQEDRRRKDSREEFGVQRKRSSIKGQKKRSGSTAQRSEVEMKRFKLRVLRRLLANFNLEKTIEKYRNQTRKEFTLRPSDYSFDCAVSAVQLKDRLFRLTGSDQIMINDRQFMNKMQQILEREDQEKMTKAEDERADLECQRLRRLVHHGVISAKELQSDGCLGQTSGRNIGSCYGNDVYSSRNNDIQSKAHRSEVQRIEVAHNCHPKPSPTTTVLLRSRDNGCLSGATIDNQPKPTQPRTSILRLPPINAPRSVTKSTSSISSFSLLSTSPRKTESHAPATPAEVCSGDHGSTENQREDTARGSTLNTPRQQRVPISADGYTAGAAASGSAAEHPSSSSHLAPGFHGAASTTHLEHPLIEKMRKEKTARGLYRLVAKISALSI